VQPISELEGVVLGIVQARQPCTAYAVRRDIQSSPSSHWGASAGAIYPLLSRMEASGLVSARVDPEDRRGRRLLRITARGRKAHRAWMFDVSSAEVAASVSDGIRSRAFFLASLSAEDRRRFLVEGLEAAEAFLEITRDHLATLDDEDEAGRMAALGGVYQAEARVRWMKELKATLSGRRSIK
jgi:DNA-binding PadR family transcriptional regulator